jgi:hypothetical protein
MNHRAKPLRPFRVIALLEAEADKLPSTYSARPIKKNAAARSFKSYEAEQSRLDNFQADVSG